VAPTPTSDEGNQQGDEARVSKEVRREAQSQRDAIASNPAVAALAPGGVQALPAEDDPDQDTPEHRQDLVESTGHVVDEHGVPSGAEVERIPAEQLTPRAGPHWEQRVPLYPGGPAV
jgi:hypothetical protein